MKKMENNKKTELKEFIVFKDRIHTALFYFKDGKFDHCISFSLNEINDILKTEGNIIKGYFYSDDFCVKCHFKKDVDFIVVMIYDDNNKFKDMGKIYKEKLKTLLL